MMKNYLLTVLILVPSLMMAQLWTANNVTVRTTNPDSCTAINIDVEAYMGCINYSVGAGTFSVSGSNITLNVNCTSSPICAGAISYPITSFTLNNLTPGTYNITANALLDRVQTNSITGGSLVVAACSTVGIMESSLASIAVYPNPTSNKLYLENFKNQGSKVQIQLFDLTGKEMTIPMSYIENKLVLELDRLNAGIYFLQISNEKEKLLKKILVE